MAKSEIFVIAPSEGCPATATCLASTQALQSRRVSSASKSPDYVDCSTVFRSPVLALRNNQGTQWFSGEPLETSRTRCSLRQSPLMTRLPRSPGSTLVLRLYQEIVHDFILLFMPPCGPHSTLLATRSLERSLLVFSTPRGLTGDDLTRSFFTCTNTSHVATCICNT
jgi:hypothetical protein